MPYTSLDEMQQKASAANIAEIPAAEQQVGMANLFSLEQLQQMENFGVPGFARMESTGSGDVQSELSGQIPTDVTEAVERSAGAHALAGGFPGSGRANDLVARDLGMTSLQVIDRGLSSMQNWMARSAQIFEPEMSSIEKSFITGPEEYKATNEQNVEQFQRNWMQNQINAMPDPQVLGMLHMITGGLGAVGGGMGMGSMMGGGGASDMASGGMVPTGPPPSGGTL